jgi:chemotaxis response regulator CheB
VVIGCSAGGLSALYPILDALPADYRGAIVIAVHDSRPGLGLLPMLLRTRSPLPVGLVRDGHRPRPGTLLLAPGGHHLAFDADGRFVLTDAGPWRPGRGFCPSIDRLFHSLATAYGPRAVAVVLSGMADDGALACRQVMARGGLVIAQDEGSARYTEMPAAAIDLARPDLILTPAQIGFALESLGADSTAPPRLFGRVVDA